MSSFSSLDLHLRLPSSLPFTSNLLLSGLWRGEDEALPSSLASWIIDNLDLNFTGLLGGETGGGWGLESRGRRKKPTLELLPSAVDITTNHGNTITIPL